MKRYEILLPNFYNNGIKIDQSLHQKTVLELKERYGGVSVQQGATIGYWKDYIDVMTKVTVDTDQPWDLEYKIILRERFVQEEIYIVRSEIDVL